MHPAHEAFRQWLQDKETVRIGQIQIRVGRDFALRHTLDSSIPDDRLQAYHGPFAARAIAMFTGDGKFRPLKSAPNLRRGWRIQGLDFEGLVAALDCFYPAALAHWHASQSDMLQTTSYRECAARQTGMYRITAKLDNASVRRVAACCCNDSECLKNPLWRVDGKTKTGVVKSAGQESNRVFIPCPEPCSLFLSFARKAVRLEQEELMDVKMTKSDLELIAEVLRSVIDGKGSEFREGDFNDPKHRQRIKYFLKKYDRVLPKRKASRKQETEE